MASTISTLTHIAFDKSQAVADVVAKGKDYDNGFNPKIEVNTNIPFYSAFKDLVGGGFAIVYVGLVAALVVAALVYAVGRIAKHQGAQTVGLASLGVILVCAIVVGGANGLVYWFSKLNATAGAYDGISAVTTAAQSLFLG